MGRRWQESGSCQRSPAQFEEFPARQARHVYSLHVLRLYQAYPWGQGATA